MEIKLNKQYQIHLSLKELHEYQEQLKDLKDRITNVCIKAVDEASEIGLQDNYKSAIKIPIQRIDNKITGGIKTTDETETYREYGTGIEGSKNPHPDKMSGWIYDVNEHGEKGWIYPTEDGYKWTKGIPAGKKFFNAVERMEKAIPLIIRDELSK